MKDLLLADLSRHYFAIGKSKKKPTLFGVLLNTFSPRFMPVVNFRIAFFFYQHKLFPIAKLFSLINFVLFGLEIAIQCKIGGGLYLPHTQGTVIGANSIGFNATIYHNVTLGARGLDFDFNPMSRPTVGDNVIVGAGAKILGGILVGNNARVAANAVVLEDVPSGATVAGVPSRVVKQTRYL
jgi:serine O-acetyltransferase